MRNGWVRDARAHFSKFLTCLWEGPPVVAQRGMKMAVLVPIDAWRRLQRAARPTLKELLLADKPRFDNLVPARRHWRRRPAPDLERGGEYIRAI